MSRIVPPGRRRLALLIAVLGLASSMLLLLAPPPASAIVCNPQNGSCPGVLTIYYSGPKLEHEVGACSCGTCTGEQTQYFVSHPVCCACD